MFSLIIVLLSIVLVAAIAAATLYFGGNAWRDSNVKAQAASIINQGQQILAADRMYRMNNGGTPPPSLQALVDGHYLSSIPVALAQAQSSVGITTAYAADTTGSRGWLMTVSNAGRVYNLPSGSVSSDLCAQVNYQAYGKDGVATSIYNSLTTQCYGAADDALNVLVVADPGVLSDPSTSLPPLVSGSSVPPTSCSSPEWLHQPTSCSSGGGNTNTGGNGNGTGTGDDDPGYAGPYYAVLTLSNGITSTLSKTCPDGAKQLNWPTSVTTLEEGYHYSDWAIDGADHPVSESETGIGGSWTACLPASKDDQVNATASMQWFSKYPFLLPPPAYGSARGQYLGEFGTDYPGSSSLAQITVGGQTYTLASYGVAMNVASYSEGGKLWGADWSSNWTNQLIRGTPTSVSLPDGTVSMVAPPPPAPTATFPSTLSLSHRTLTVGLTNWPGNNLDSISVWCDGGWGENPWGSVNAASTSLTTDLTGLDLQNCSVGSTLNVQIMYDGGFGYNSMFGTLTLVQ